MSNSTIDRRATFSWWDFASSAVRLQRWRKRSQEHQGLSSSQSTEYIGPSIPKGRSSLSRRRAKHSTGHDPDNLDFIRKPVVLSPRSAVIGDNGLITSDDVPVFMKSREKWTTPRNASSVHTARPSSITHSRTMSCSSQSATFYLRPASSGSCSCLPSHVESGFTTLNFTHDRAHADGLHRFSQDDERGQVNCSSGSSQDDRVEQRELKQGIRLDDRHCQNEWKSETSQDNRLGQEDGQAQIHLVSEATQNEGCAQCSDLNFDDPDDSVFSDAISSPGLDPKSVFTLDSNSTEEQRSSPSPLSVMEIPENFTYGMQPCALTVTHKDLQTTTQSVSRECHKVAQPQPAFDDVTTDAASDNVPLQDGATSQILGKFLLMYLMGAL